MTTISVHRDAGGVAVHAVHADGPRATLAARAPDAATLAVIAAFERVAHETAKDANDLKPAALARSIADKARAHVRPAWRAKRDSIQAAKRSHAERLATLASAPADALLAAEDRAAFRAIPVAHQHRWIGSADRNALAALVSVGRSRWPDLPDAAWDAAVDRLQRLTWLENTGVLARFPIPATAENPAPVGPDLAAAEAFADERMTEFRAEMDAVRHGERFLRDTIAVVAVAADLTVADAFALLTDG